MSVWAAGRARRCARIVALPLALSVGMAACTSSTSDSSLPSAAGAADSFASSFNEGDVPRVVASFDKEAKTTWPARRLKAWLARQKKLGHITSMSIQTSDDVAQPQPTSSPTTGRSLATAAPYSITYRSTAARGPVRLRGELPLTYSAAKGRWEVGFSRALLWPGVGGARAWHVTERWPHRAPILDRRGRKLARGSAGRRSYPQGSLAGTTIGHLGDAGKKDLKDLPPFYRAGDFFGASGLEAAFNDRLSGSPSQFLQVANAKPKVVATLGRTHGLTPRPLRSTLDMRVQRAAETGYGSTTGGAVVMDPSSGNLLAVVSSATIDPNDYVGAEDFQPFNYALAGLYAPGSSFKIVTASAALDSKKLTQKSTFSAPPDYRGVTNFESESFSAISFAGALAASVNTVFAQIADRVGAKLMYDYATRFGFNRAPDSKLRAATSSYPRPVDDGELLWSGVGQARDLATPMEMASVAATIANRGVRMEPRVAFAQEPSPRRVVRPKVAGQMNRMMQGVVTGGTGVAAQIPGVPVAGKTGTAEVSVNGTIMNHAWFICFAPADKPRVAVAVVSDLGGIGGEVAAPLARAILEGVLPLTRR